MGVNANGLISKLVSFNSTIKSFDFPSVISVQETKQGKAGKFNIDGYESFERTRDSNRGGLLTLVEKSLDPILTHVGQDDNEIITVEATL